MTLPSQLTTLEARGLILVAQLQPELEYLFRHALIQEAAYSSLVKIDRRRLHLAVGQALERLYPGRLTAPELTPVLARHFAEAGDQPRALRYFTLAGRGAAEVYANAEAIHHFGRALEIAQSLPAAGEAVTDLFLRRGRALELNAQDAAALTNYEALEGWAVAGGDRRAQLASLAARATVYVKPSVEQNLALGYDLSQQALTLARELGDRPAEAKVMWNLLQHYWATSENEEALEHGEMALALAREQNLREQTAYVLTDLLKVYFQTNQPDRARAALEEARSIWRELGLLNMLADNLATTSMHHIFAGDYEQGLARSQEAQQISQRIGNLWNQAYALYMVDVVHFDRGDVGQAIEVAEASMRLAAQAGFAQGLSQAGFDLALIYGYMGALPRAFDAAHQIMARAWALTGVEAAWPLLEVLTALLYLLDGRPAQAQAALDESPISQDPAELERQFILTRFVFAAVKAELALARGDHQQALALAGDITLALRQSGVRLFLTDALLLHGRALRAAGRMDEARAMLAAARAEAEDVGSRRMLWQILAELAAIEAAGGDQAAALALQQRAADEIEFIAEHAGSAELAASFLNRPSVRALRQRAGRTAPGAPA